tara:strand:- start:39 stop:686 length:648 start_codon:yes stop_codon:yes gene_type:complete
MTNAKITKTTGATISQDASEGKAIAKLISDREAKGIKAFATDTGENGMDTRLGNLMVKLSTESSLPTGRPSRQQLETNGLYKVKGVGDSNLRTIRSSALWFVTNRAEAELFNTETGGKFSNIHGLQQAMAKAAKEAAKEEMKADTDSDSDSDTDTDSDSVIGGLDTDTCNFTHDENTMAEAVVEMAKAHGVSLPKLMMRLSAIATQEALEARKAA